MKPNLAEVVKQNMRWIEEHWPSIHALIPDTAIPHGHDSLHAAGMCTHPARAIDQWVNSRGGYPYATAVPPEMFFWLGLQNAGGSEYLYLMWYRNGRRFWFYDQYVMYYDNSRSSPENTRNALTTALDRWSNSPDDVIYSGPWGWYDPSTHHFEIDSTVMGQELLRIRGEN